jgi:hypothetical protein
MVRAGEAPLAGHDDTHAAAPDVFAVLSMPGGGSYQVDHHVGNLCRWAPHAVFAERSQPPTDGVI